jgi:cell division protein ZapE
VWDYPRPPRLERFEGRITVELGGEVIASAQDQPIGLYLGTQGREVFEFERTASRLIEMRSNDYLALPHGARAVSAAPAET